MSHYDHQAIEAKWQDFWAEQRVAEVDLNSPENKFYMLMMFPYPSGDRLHVGHGRNYILGDALYRYLRMNGKRALNPMGWDAFGLPAENAAIERQVHPQDWTLNNIAVMKEQFRHWGILYDWSKEVTSCLPDYYRWNQWLFLRMLEKGLAYKKMAPVNWCPSCATVLANEQVVDGRCERCHTEVVQKDLEQWFYRITDFAERLLAGLDTLDNWPERVKVMQRNWIGRSEGAEIDFDVPELGERLTVFTTRPDTIHGATFMVLAPEHRLVPELISQHPERGSIESWIDEVRNTPRLHREDTGGAKVGVDTGRVAINPATGETIPIWLANYVLTGYGSGAIMAVPAHDARDLEFARQEALPVRLVYCPTDQKPAADLLEEPILHEGEIVGTGRFDGLTDSLETRQKFVDWMEKEGWGRQEVTYRLRDWLISRQRYWGTPIPIIYCDDCGAVPVPESELPVTLPYDVDFTGRQGNPLSRNQEFVRASCPRCGKEGRRETDTMDTFVDSSWYFLRYLSPADDEKIFDTKSANVWCPVDQYIGGIEHAILHLLYARFICRVLYDFDLVSFEEPFANLFNQGMITRRSEKTGRVEKMSKSRGNTVSPDLVIERMGADAERVYTLFLGPPEDEVEWQNDGLSGASRFLNRIWRITARLTEAGQSTTSGTGSSDVGVDELDRLRHRTIQRVTDDLQRFKFNTAVAALMEFQNGLLRTLETGVASHQGCREALETLVQLLHPFAPHLTEEIWELLGKEGSLLESRWPTFDEEKTRQQRVTLIVQVDGKLRDRIEVAATAPEEELRSQALASSRVQKFLGDREVEKAIVVPGRLVNLVTRKTV